MSYAIDPRYTPVGNFSPLDDDRTIYSSPGSYARPFPQYDPNRSHGDLGDAGIAMESRRPNPPRHDRSHDTMYSTFSSNNGSQPEMHSFLHDPMNKIDTFYTANTFVPYKDHSGKQLRHILLGSSFRWLITAGLCGGYILATRLWQQQGAQSEARKKVYNALTTGISIALGLNIASAFRDMALNMRWPILSGRKRNLVELDLILNADSLTKLVKLMLVARRPLVVFVCIFWLLVNLISPNGLVSIPKLDHFYPQGEVTSDPSIHDEEYAAHMYGALSYTYRLNTSDNSPEAGKIYQPQGAMLYYDLDSRSVEHTFSDSPTDEPIGTFSVYTSRTIKVTYDCSAYPVTANGTGTSIDLVVETLGNMTVEETVPDSTTFLTHDNHTCADNQRCSVVEAFEASETDPWYYVCNITLGETQKDPYNVSYISDHMAQIATASIAQVGYTDYLGVASQIYPRDSPWGSTANGSTDEIGLAISVFALGTIAGATMYNPYTSYIGSAPSQGVYLHVGHPYFFYLIIGLICGCHLIFIVVVAVLTNRVMVGPDGHLSMSLLLRPIADALNGVSGGKENKAFRDAKRNTTVLYEKPDRGGQRWKLNMIDR
ncbi:hypothetical protein ONS95_006395 [Cadophora gregata]|uniref:uncharacterized protein n=1 Tax=Cadophora gregata TaxID=51156 RepID=UPI0026DCE3BA|nr:uncharacterized protein ONS95_006395 [Cadophora gregata]KAK0102798.1 hypothetical protein ONS95_006395 [Cadophora gregata]